MTDASMAVKLRRAFRSEAADIAAIHRQARRTAMPWLPEIHTPEEDRAFFRDTVMEECDVWVAADKGNIAGFIALRPGHVDHPVCVA